MARIFGVSPYSASRTIILLDDDTSYQLPSLQLVPALGTIFELCDNLRLGLTVTVGGQFANGATSMTISGSPGWVYSFEALENFYAARP